MLWCLAAPVAIVAPSGAVVDDAKQQVEAGKPEEALRLLAPWLTAHPADETALALRARANVEAGHLDEALADYDRLLALAPEDADYMLGAATALRGLGRPEEAVKRLDGAREAAPDYADVWKLELAILDDLGPVGAERAKRMRAYAADKFPDAAWLAPAVARPAAEVLPWSLEAGGSYAFLTNGYAPWAGASAILTREFGPRQVAVLTAEEAYRFGIHDQQAGVAFYQPLGHIFSVSFEGSLSPGHQVLPIWSVGGAAYAGLPGGWDLGLDVHGAAYTTAQTLRESLSLEKYLGNFRLAYTISVSELPGAPTALGHAGVVEYTYGELESREQLILHSGTEEEFVGPNALLTSGVVGAALTGRTWLSRPWGITHVVEYERQGASYDRGGLSLGIVHAF